MFFSGQNESPCNISINDDACKTRRFYTGKGTASENNNRCLAFRTWHLITRCFSTGLVKMHHLALIILLMMASNQRSGMIFLKKRIGLAMPPTL